MDLTGIRLNCRSTDTRKQIPSLPIYRRFSTASINPVKMVNYPFVRLTPSKMEEAPIYLQENKMSVDLPTAGEKTNLFRTFSKSCHQLPVTISGFVGSKSQVHSSICNREPHQIWDLVDPIFRRVSEFVHLNHNLGLLGTLCPDNSTLAFILSNSDKCQLKNPQLIPTKQPSPSIQNNTPVSVQKTEPKNQLSSLPKGPLFKISEHFVPALGLSYPLPLSADSSTFQYTASQPSVPSKKSQSETSKSTQTVFKLAEEPVVLCSIADHSVLSKPELGQVNDCERTLGESSKPILILPKEHKSYAEVAKMARRRGYLSDQHENRTANFARHNLKRNYFNGYNRSKSYQRSTDNTNWREHCSELKDVRRDKFLPVHSREVVHPNANNVSSNFDTPLQSLDTKTNRQGYQKRNHGRYNNDRHQKKNERPRIVHEKHPNYDKNRCVETGQVSESCQYYNPKENYCKNWRCRLHSNKPSPYRDISDSSFESSPSNRTKTTFDKFIKIPCRMVTLGFTPEQQASASEKSPLGGSPEYMRHLTKLKEECGEAISNFRRRSFTENKDTILTSLSRGATTMMGCVNRDSVSSSGSEAKRRSLSECSVDSEDSFVIFGDDDDECETLDSEGSDESSDWSECETENEDEVDACTSLLCLAVEYEGSNSACSSSPRMKEINARWQLETDHVARDGGEKKPTVQFASAPAVVHTMVSWEYAYRTARCGPWEQLARDRERFRQRALRCEPVLAAVMTPEHRLKAWLRNQQLTSPDNQV